MEHLKIYWHPNCSSCKKAVKFLNTKDVEYELVDLREKAPRKSELKTMMQVYAGSEKKLFNTSGQAYRNNNYKDKITSMSKTDMINDLNGNGLLVKRPFALNSKKQGLVGFKEDEWNNFLK